MVDFELLARVVEEVSETPKELLISKKRTRPLVELRMICSNILKNNKLSVEKIGKLLNINHATVSYHLKMHKTLLIQKDGKYKSKFEAIDGKYKRILDLNKESVKDMLLEKKKKLEKMLYDVNETLKLLDEKIECEELKL